MTVAELIKALQPYNPNLPVRLVVEDEVDSTPPCEAYWVERITNGGDVYVEVLAQ